MCAFHGLLSTSRPAQAQDGMPGSGDAFGGPFFNDFYIKGDAGGTDDDPPRVPPQPLPPTRMPRQWQRHGISSSCPSSAASGSSRNSPHQTTLSADSHKFHSGYTTEADSQKKPERTPMKWPSQKTPAQPETYYCCFRRGAQEPIVEDQEQRVFHKDFRYLDLMCLLRAHNIEPSDALISDLMRWQME